MVKTVNAIYTNGFSLKKHYDNRVTETEGKKFNINGLGTTSALNAVKNKVSNVSDLVKKKLWCENIRHWEQIFQYIWLWQI